MNLNSKVLLSMKLVLLHMAFLCFQIIMPVSIGQYRNISVEIPTAEETL